jgi:hypothetical protein
MALAEEQEDKAKREVMLKVAETEAERKMGFVGKAAGYGMRAIDATVGLRNAAGVVGLGAGIDNLQAETDMMAGGVAPAGPQKAVPATVASPLIPRGKGNVAIDFLDKEDKDKMALKEDKEKLTAIQAEREQAEIDIKEAHLAKGQHAKLHKGEEKSLHDKFDVLIERLNHKIKLEEIAISKRDREKRHSAND